MQSEYSLEFTTSNFQFFIADKESPQDTGEFWTNTWDLESRLTFEAGIIGVGIGSYGKVKATLLILKKQSNRSSFETFDHVVEASLVLSSGIVQILNCPDSIVELELDLQPGEYRVRVYSSNLSNADVYEGNRGTDTYLIEIWPDEQKERVVLKEYLG